MPELAEVETTRRGIAPHVTGRRLERIVVYDSRLRWPVPADLDARMSGRTIDRVDRRSKYLLFHAGGAALLVHLGMTGTLRVYRDPSPWRTHDHVDIVLDDGTLLRYCDPRRFGAMLWRPAARDGHHCFQLEYFVYGRKGEPCRVCGKPIRQSRQGGRSSFYCPGCQRR